MAIDVETIAVNRYAPRGSEAINLYGDELASGLTLAQLVQQVCLRSAAAQEAQSVIKMNAMTSGSQTLNDAAAWLEKIMDGSANWSDAKTFITGRLGVPASALPDGIDTYAKRMQVASAMKDKMDVLSQSQQEDMIDLQTMVNRRDVAYSTSSNVVKSLGMSMSGDAQNFK